MSYATGSLVRARGRDWVVLPPESREDGDWLRLKPLGGTNEEIITILPALELEDVRPAIFDAPDPEKCGDARSCALLRDAVRLGLRATTGPFRCFGHIAVDPRPYQFVPLLMAMKQPVVRLLIADDVGIGKTVESLLIARELLDRGEIRRMSVLCPPQLAEQWQHELEEKFHIEAQLVLPSTIARLERGLDVTTSIFEAWPFTIVSLDYIKSDRHRQEFLRACPEMVIVDEAHACASASGNRSGKQRYELVRKLAEDSNRHMIFVTATPHSGKEDVFRSLLAFLNPDFSELPDDLSGREHEEERRRLAAYFVQRRRGDIRAYMDNATPFPQRKAQEVTWRATPKWKELFDSVLALARSSVRREGTVWQQRIQWWSALALLRAVSSSPAAAAATLRTRALGNGLESEAHNTEQLDALGTRALFDLDSGDDSSMSDELPGANDTEGSEQDVRQDEAESSAAFDAARAERRRTFARLASMAENLMGEEDAKLKQCIPHIKKLVGDGYSPIVFCRFIPTAEYVAEELRRKLSGCTVDAVTGLLPPEERELRVSQLAESERRILVCTDCLSEGINLQNHFNAVIHYDLSWNPTRHEQREGRVDRFGQPLPEVRVITWYGTDNPIDGMVLDVLLRKHESIRKSLGISVPIPEDSEKVMQTLVQGLLLHGKPAQNQTSLLLPGMEDYLVPEKKRLAAEWDVVARAEEKRSRTLFAQQSIKVDDVALSLGQAEEAAGGAQSVQNFVCSALPMLGAVHNVAQKHGQTVHSFNMEALVQRRNAGLDFPPQLEAVFRQPCGEGQTLLSRTHPLVERLASWLAETALDAPDPGAPDFNMASPVARCGVMRSNSVQTRSTLVLCRFRFQIVCTGSIEHVSLAEECALLAFANAPGKAQWLDDAAAKKLLAAQPDLNVSSEQARRWLGEVHDALPALMPHIRHYAEERGQALLEAHRRVRDAARARGLRYAVQPQGEPDILGFFVYLPCLRAGGEVVK